MCMCVFLCARALVVIVIRRTVLMSPHVHGPVHLSVCVGVRVCLCVSVRLFQRVTLINAHPAFIPLCLRTEKKQNTKKNRERERVGGVGVGWG